MIKSDFQNDEFEFLNLSYPCPVTYMGLTYLNAMSAFIAMKIPDEFETERRKFTRLNAQKARVKEKSMRVRKDWDSVKGFILREILYAKFSENEDLKKKLLAIPDDEIIYAPAFKDTYLGVYGGKGKNMLGRFIVEILDELRGE